MSLRALPLLALVLILDAQQAAAQLAMETDAFPAGGVIPARYSARGDNVQPGFTISAAPDATVSYALVFYNKDIVNHDDTRDGLHWMVWNIPSSQGFEEGMLPEGSMQGMNMTGQKTYFGPAAPGPHEYVFDLYALSETLDLDESASYEDLRSAMQGKILDRASYVGRYRFSAGD